MVLVAWMGYNPVPTQLMLDVWKCHPTAQTYCLSLSYDEIPAAGTSNAAYHQPCLGTWCNYEMSEMA
jgi:hypothetical protein